jgi:ABC-type branched-subunit amino acid transport system substrate-binding protein
MRTLIRLVACTAGASLVLIAGANAATKRPSSAPTVVVPHGQRVQIALANDFSGYGAAFGPSVENAVRLAVVAHPDVHGFPIQINAVNAPCGDPAADLAAAQNIVANSQNVGVLGQLCSTGFDQALAVYQTAGIVTISGSATSDTLPSFGPTVFDRTAVSDGDGGTAWYTQVSTLPRDLAWRDAYTALLGTAPTDFADLYYDAAKVLIRNLQSTSWVDSGGNLVVNRSALARAVRHTTDVRGVTCTITIDPATGNRVNDAKSLARCAA